MILSIQVGKVISEIGVTRNDSILTVVFLFPEAPPSPFFVIRRKPRNLLFKGSLFAIVSAHAWFKLGQKVATY